MGQFPNEHMVMYRNVQRSIYASYADQEFHCICRLCGVLVALARGDIFTRRGGANCEV